jgi:hypothetical protein
MAQCREWNITTHTPTLTSSGVRPVVDQRAFGVLSGRYMRPAKAPPLTASTSPVT